jgi:hypothetical protein
LTEEEKNDPRNKGPGEIPKLKSDGLYGVYGRSPQTTFKNGEKPPAVHSWEENLKVPDALDWRNMNGTNYLSWNKN